MVYTHGLHTQFTHTVYTHGLHTFMHLGDAFIQSELHLVHYQQSKYISPALYFLHIPFWDYIFHGRMLARLPHKLPVCYSCKLVLLC